MFADAERDDMDDHRLLVVNGELVAATRRTPGHVVGDGEHTIAELIDIVNLDPRRGVGHEKVLTRLELDAQAQKMLERAGLTATSVPAPGATVQLRSTANLSTGGTATDVTDIIHPDNREMAERAVRAIGLDVGGVDFLSKNISESYRKIGGGICEVNAAPGFRMHVAPSEGTARDVAAPVIDMLFPPGAAVRVPIAAITGTNGKSTTTALLAHILGEAARAPLIAARLVADAGRPYLRLDCWAGNPSLCTYYDRVGLTRRGRQDLGGGFVVTTRAANSSKARTPRHSGAWRSAWSTLRRLPSGTPPSFSINPSAQCSSRWMGTTALFVAGLREERWSDLP